MTILAAAWSVFVGGWLLLSLRRLRTKLTAREGVEREAWMSATSTAFLATMIGAVAYGVLESSIDAPKLTMWCVCSFGIGVFVVALRVQVRRAR
jgi:hypothetical protein